MEEAVPPASQTSTRGAWLTIAGISFIAIWIVVHVCLFYLICAEGIVMDVLLNILRAVMFPGTSNSPNPDILNWIPFLQAGLILSGVAGVPAGLAFFWRGQRGVLLLSFVIAFVLGILFDLYAIYTMATSAFRLPS
ncbi:MAG: hypothetical protein D4R65_07450 [Verrucomicrobiaceae bacterium]|nr:MAG: hypothetical protein D4R65_07450 [Verrucomicrobiaceae bacterium]